MGIGYHWDHSHYLSALIGAYKINNRDHYQTNFIYRYSHWHVNETSFSWNPIQVGVFFVTPWEKDRYFKKSPQPPYPQDNYYQQTAYRYGLEASSKIFLSDNKISIGLGVRVLDTGIVAIYNNSEKDLQYYTSTTISLHYYF